MTKDELAEAVGKWTQNEITDTDMIAQIVDFLLEAQPAADDAPSGEGADEYKLVVEAFAKIMVERLWDNDVKGGWQSETIDYLYGALCAEVKELIEVVRKTEEQDRVFPNPQIAREAADVANFAMMIADVCGAFCYRQREAEGAENERT